MRRSTIAIVGLIVIGCSESDPQKIDSDAGISTDSFVAPDASAADAFEADAIVADAVAPPDAGLDWDPPPAPVVCRADGVAPLLDQALAATGLDRPRFGFTATDLGESSFYRNGDLDDPYLLSWFIAARGAPHRAGCLEGELAGTFNAALSGRHPVAAAIRRAAFLLDRPVVSRPIDLAVSFADAAERICLAAADIPCPASSGDLPPDLSAALAPLLNAIAEGVIARRAREASSAHDADWWRRFGGNGLIVAGGLRPDLTADRDYLLGLDRAGLYTAAAQIAFAVEHTDWSIFTGRMGVTFDLQTPAGMISVRDAAVQNYPADQRDVLLLIDLGGDDQHFDDVASNTSGRNSVSIVVDLAGNDTYSYVAVQTPFDRPELLPADDGRRFAGNMEYGNLSLSTRSRQGSARNGVAMLFDLGAGEDTYASLVASQGHAFQGVGVLYDQGGRDSYSAESNSQGSAQYGIGLLIDEGDGWDTRRSFTNSQGFGYSGGAGILFDRGGDDTYSCDHGDPARGGVPLYYSPQLPGTGNTSMCQGAGFGRRGVSSVFQSGGVGVLIDRDGNDRYEASVFAQGTGYWQGTGVLSDASGSDRYDAFWYVQGGAAHYAIGALIDGGPGTDLLNAERGAYNVALGAGHDFSIGVFIDEAGDSEYHLPQLAAGASNCNGVGLFVDNGGDDNYLASSDLGSGVGHVSGECATDRPTAPSIGVMIDAGGRDTYNYPMSTHPLPTEGGTWGYAASNVASEHGAGLDATGETGVHGESITP